MFAYFFMNSIPSTQLIMSMGASSGSHAGLQLRVLSSTSVDVNIAGIGSIPVSGLQSIVQRWCSIAVTKTSGSSSYLLYFNGVAVNGGGTGTANFTNSPLYIGSDQTPTAAFNGNISCAGIWNAALSSDEILALHRNPAFIQGSPKVFYRANEGTGTTLIDISGNGNNGSLTGTSWDGGQVPYGIRAPIKISSPLDIISPLFYINASKGVTLDESNKVSAIADLSPNGFNFSQSTAASRPGYSATGINGLPALQFTAAGDEFMTATSNFIGGAKAHTLFVVIRGTGSGPSMFVGFLALGSVNAGGQTSTIGLNNSNQFWFGGAGYGEPVIQTTIANNTSYAIGKVNNGRTDFPYFNGARLRPYVQAANYAITPVTDVLLGRYVTGGQAADYYLAVAVGWNRDLSSAEMEALNDWAYTTYGVGASLSRSQISSPRFFTGVGALRNPGFENQPTFTAATNTAARWIDGTAAGSTTNSTYGWAVLGVSGTSSAQFDTSQSWRGTGSLKLSVGATGSFITTANIPAVTYANMQFAVPALPNTAYTCTFRMKTEYTSGDSSNGASIAFVERSGASTALATNTSTEVKATTDWKEYTVSFTTNANTAFITPRPQILGQTGTGTLIMDAWFDDIVISSSVYNRSAVT